MANYSSQTLIRTGSNFQYYANSNVKGTVYSNTFFTPLRGSFGPVEGVQRLMAMPAIVYRGQLNGQYVYSFGVPPSGATNIVIVKMGA
jgi:hypothetical protein